MLVTSYLRGYVFGSITFVFFWIYKDHITVINRLKNLPFVSHKLSVEEKNLPHIHFVFSTHREFILVELIYLEKTKDLQQRMYVFLRKIDWNLLGRKKDLHLVFINLRERIWWSAEKPFDGAWKERNPFKCSIGYVWGIIHKCDNTGRRFRGSSCNCFFRWRICLNLCLFMNELTNSI